MREHRSTVFGEMSALALATGSVNLGQGFPDTDGPQVVKDAAIRAIAEGRGNQYPPVHGVPELRAAIAQHQHRFYGIELDPVSDVVVATGASEAIAAALLALVDDGDEVVMFSPWFDLYGAAVSLARGTRVEVPLTAGDVPARCRRAAGGDHSAHPRAPAQLAPQPDRFGVHLAPSSRRSPRSSSSTTCG